MELAYGKCRNQKYLKRTSGKGRKTFGREPRKSKGYAKHSFLYESRTWRNTLVKYTNLNNIPQEIIRAVSNDSYSKGASTISVTGLLQPPRIRVLKEEHDDKIF